MVRFEDKIFIHVGIESTGIGLSLSLSSMFFQPITIKYNDFSSLNFEFSTVKFNIKYPKWE